ncbi:MAG: amidase [Actinomycetota bacterium]|nr:amidase [Actinomycetota bacterium]
MSNPAGRAEHRTDALLAASALEQARLVREGQVSSPELVEASLRRAEELQARLNCFVSIDGERALAAAESLAPGDPRPFAGVPTAVKDIAPSADHTLTLGSDLFGDFFPGFDAHAVRRLREAGLVVIGQTTAPEMGIVNVTEGRRYGPTRNPWDPERTPGGSSGGAAAAVAGGAFSLAHGSDGGGSIRIPAACCGLVGLKPSRGRVSAGPMLGESLLIQDGVLTRTVADTASALDVLAGYEPGDANWAPPPDEPFLDAARRDPGRLRVGVTLDGPLDAELDPESERAVHETATLLGELGHSVGEVDPPWKGGDLLPVFMKLWCVSIGSGVVQGGLVTGREPSPELVEPLTWWLYEQARALSSLDYALAIGQLQAHARSMIASLWADHDVVVLPTLARRPLRIGELDTQSDDPAAAFRLSGQFTPHTALFNVSGQPAISLPLYHGDDGLPTAVQLAGPPAGEATLLSLAAQLEDTRPWANRRPPLP